MLLGFGILDLVCRYRFSKSCFTVLAAVLGAAPFLGPYLAGIPAALDVWLQGRPMAAIMLPIAQAAPIAFLDAAVYAEIKE